MNALNRLKTTQLFPSPFCPYELLKSLPIQNPSLTLYPCHLIFARPEIVSRPTRIVDNVSPPSQSSRAKLVRLKRHWESGEEWVGPADGLERKYGGGLVVTFSNT